MIGTSATSTEHYEELVRILGKRYIKAKVESPFDFIHIASKGLSPHIIVNFKNHFKIPIEIAAAMLNTSGPTVYRWVRTNKTLESIFSVKLFEVADLFLYGSDVFGSEDNFFKWMNLPNTALGGMEPQELVMYPDGVSKVRDVIGRIEHGVYS
ncbi:MAG: antitoxin Xre/MbcA/ParS toxin-binding domain-containing protein [Saprospiraceae bacterium]